MFQLNPQNNAITLDGINIEDFAKEFSTPCYIYSKEQIQKNCRNLKSAIEKHFKNSRIQYAVKANSNPHVLKIIKDEGFGADCSSPLELYLAKEAGFDLSNSTYTGNYESLDDLAYALDTNVNLNLDDYHRLDDVLKIKVPEFISFRINPGIGRGGFEHIVTGGTDAKFGIPYEQTRIAYEKAKAAGVKRFGIHMMTGSNILEPFYFAEITQKIMTIIEENINDLGIELEFINIGGGLGVPYYDNEEELNLEQSFHLVEEVFSQHLGKLNIGKPKLAMEPGRYLVANAGVLLSSVTHVKESYRNYVGTDGGMTTLLRPALYGAYHRAYIHNSPQKLHDKSYRICGQICENSDIHPEERHFFQPKAGDLMVHRDCGAYGFTMSSNYNNRPRCSEVLIDEGKARLIRKAENFQDLLKNIVPL